MTRAPLWRRANTSSTSDTNPTAVMMRPGTSRPRKLVRRDAAITTTPRASTGSPLQTRSDVSRAGRGVVGRNAPRPVASSTNENTAVTDSVNAHCPNDRRRMASADWSGTATASVNSATISSCSHSAGSARSTARPARASSRSANTSTTPITTTARAAHLIQPKTCTAVSPRSSARSTPRVSSTRHQASSRRSSSTFSVQSDSRATPTSAAIHHCRLAQRDARRTG